MLLAIRDKTQGIIATIILGLVIIPFALWGTYSYFEGGSDINVAEVDGIEISQQTYRITFDRLLASNINPAILQSPEFKRQVLDGLIDQTLLVRNGIERGYRIGDAELARFIRETPQFQRQGQFDPLLYEAALRREGTSEQSFEQRLRALQIAGQIQTGLTQSAILLPADREALIRLWSEQREFDYVVVGRARFISGVRVTEDAIKEYYDSHPAEFKTPEQVRVEYLELSLVDLASDFEPSEAVLRQAYEEEQGRFLTPEQRRVSHILFEVPTDAKQEDLDRVLQKARDIEKQLRGGADFAALAKEHSADSGTAANGGDLGFVTQGALPRELEQAVAKLKVGEITAPVKTSYGYHIVKLTEYTAATGKSFEQASDELKQLVRRRRAEEAFYQKVEELSNLVYEHPDSLAPAAEALDLKPQQSDWFSREGGEGIAANPKVVEAAFSLDVLHESRNSEAIELGADKLVALRVIGHRDAARKPLDDVRAQIRTLLQKRQATAEANALGGKIYADLLGGQSLEQLAKANGLNFERAQISRINPKQVNRQVIAAVFEAPRPQGDTPVYGEVDLGGAGRAVFMLKSVTTATTTKADDALVRRVESALQQRFGAEQYRDYLVRLRETADIKVFPDKL
jgi:peptidyl-prolyl cis-trans isomerase D